MHIPFNVIDLIYILGCFSQDRLYYMVVASNPEMKQKFIPCPRYLSSVGQREGCLCVIYLQNIFLLIPDIKRDRNISGGR